MRIFTQAGWIAVQVVIFAAMMTLTLSIPAPDTPRPGIAFVFSVFAAYLVTFIAVLAVQAFKDVRGWRQRRQQRQIRS